MAQFAANLVQARATTRRQLARMRAEARPGCAARPGTAAATRRTRASCRSCCCGTCCRCWPSSVRRTARHAHSSAARLRSRRVRRPLLRQQAHDGREQEARARRRRAEEGCVSNTPHAVFSRARRHCPSGRSRFGGASACVGWRCAAYAAAAASSAPGMLTRRAACVPSASSATASSRMSAPVTACPLRRLGSRPNAAAEMGRKGNGRSEGAPAPPDAAPDHGCEAAAAAAPPAHGGSAAPPSPPAGVAPGSRACRSTRCASGLRNEQGVSVHCLRALATRHEARAPGRERADAGAYFVADGVQLREAVAEVSVHLSQGCALGGGLDARAQVDHRAHRAAGHAPRGARNARNVLRPEELRTGRGRQQGNTDARGEALRGAPAQRCRARRIFRRSQPCEAHQPLAAALALARSEAYRRARRGAMHGWRESARRAHARRWHCAKCMSSGGREKDGGTV